MLWIYDQLWPPPPPPQILRADPIRQDPLYNIHNSFNSISIAAAAPFASPCPSTPFPPYTYSLPLLLLSAPFPFFSYTHFPIYTPFLYSLSTPFLSYLLLSSAPPIPLSTHTLCISYTLPLILLYIFASLSTPFLCSSSITLSPPPPPLPLSVSFPLPSPSSSPFPLSLLPIFPKFTSSLTPVP